MVLERIIGCCSRGGGARSTGSLGVQDGGRWWICCGEEWVEGLGQSVEQLDVGCAGDMGVNRRVGELFRNSAINRVEDVWDCLEDRGMVRQVVGGDRLITLLRMACISGVDGRIPVGTCEADGGGDQRDFSPCTRA